MKVSTVLSRVIILLVMVYSTSLFAASKEAIAGPKIARLPSQIKINPADIDNLTNAAIDDKMEKAKADGKNISSASADMVKLLSNMEQDISKYRNKVTECKNKNYTTQDQKDAHCTDDMTVAQCSKLLFNMCKWKENAAVLQDTVNMLSLINNRLKPDASDLEQSTRYINTNIK
jgi:hypothetical protein